MTPAQQAAKIKELAEIYADFELQRDPHSVERKNLHTAIDELAAECDRLSGLGKMSDQDAFESWYLSRGHGKLWLTIDKGTGKYFYEGTRELFDAWQAAEEHKRAVIALALAESVAAKQHSAQTGEVVK